MYRIWRLRVKEGVFERYCAAAQYVSEQMALKYGRRRTTVARAVDDEHELVVVVSRAVGEPDNAELSVPNVVSVIREMQDMSEPGSDFIGTSYERVLQSEWVMTEPKLISFAQVEVTPQEEPLFLGWVAGNHQRLMRRDGINGCELLRQTDALGHYIHATYFNTPTMPPGQRPGDTDTEIPRYALPTRRWRAEIGMRWDYLTSELTRDGATH
jgi:hypothetical protein